MENMEPQAEELLKSRVFESFVEDQSAMRGMKLHEIKQRAIFKKRKILGSYKQMVPEFTWG